MRTLVRVLGALVAGALGIGVGLLGALAHSMSVRMLGLSLPVGLLPALAGLAGLLVGTGTILRSRLVLLAPAAGWALAVFPLAVPRPEGDLVVAASASGYVFLLGGAVLIGACLTLPYDGDRAPRPGVSSRSGDSP